MDMKTFLTKLGAILHASESPVHESFPLDEENWDSVARIGTIALIDELFGVTVSAKELKDCRMVRQLVELVQRNVS